MDIHVLLFSSFWLQLYFKRFAACINFLVCFVFYCCHNKHQKLSGLKKTQICFVTTLYVKSLSWLSWFLSAPSVTRSKSRWQSVGFSGGSRKNLLCAHSSCSWNPEPCGCRTDVPISSLAVSEWLLLYPGGLSPISALGSLHLRKSEDISNPFHEWILSDFPFCPIFFSSFASSQRNIKASKVSGS